MFVLRARVHSFSHTYSHIRYACTLVTKAETIQLLPGLFDLLVSQFFSYLRRHHSLKTRFLVLLIDYHLVWILYTGTLTTKEC